MSGSQQALRDMRALCDSQWAVIQTLRSDLEYASKGEALETAQANKARAAQVAAERQARAARQSLRTWRLVSAVLFMVSLALLVLR